jgi:hypothetical protein
VELDAMTQLAVMKAIVSRVSPSIRNIPWVVTITANEVLDLIEVAEAALTLREKDALGRDTGHDTERLDRALERLA